MTRWTSLAGAKTHTRDCWGQYCYVRNLDDGRVWSACRQPIGRNADEYESDLRSDRAIIHRRDGELESCYEVAVVPGVDAEVRRITLTNRGERPRTLEVTTYAELALNPRSADQAHPAFAKLFLETEYNAAPPALLCRRRPRAPDQQPVWALQVLASEAPEKVEYETDRARFLGRGRSTENPAVMDCGVALSGTIGPVLDPVFSLRQRIRVEPGAVAVLAFTTAAAKDRVQALALAARFSSLETVDGVFKESTASDAARRAELGLSPDDAALFQRLAASVLFSNPSLRSRESVALNRLGRPGLWPYAISGDLPIILVRIGTERNLELIRQILLAHAYWRGCRLVADLVLLHDGGSGDELRRQLQDLVHNAPAADMVDRPGGIFIRDASRMPAGDATLLEAAARVVLRGSDGPLAAQLGRAEVPAPPLPHPLRTTRDPEKAASQDSPAPAEMLLFNNGLGGFTPDGREYVIALPAGERPPAPWTNVLANPAFGCLVTEAGLGYTWAGNSQMNRLTPWSNDPVSDPPGRGGLPPRRGDRRGLVADARSLRAADARPSATARATPASSEPSHGLEQELLVLVPPDDPVKLIRLRVRNAGDRPRRLSATFYAEWVLGTRPRQAPPCRSCASATRRPAPLLARNAWAGDFAGQVAFAAVGPIRTDTAPPSYRRSHRIPRPPRLAGAPAALGRSRPVRPRRCRRSTRAPR